jgi:hypothetical protein
MATFFTIYGNGGDRNGGDGGVRLVLVDAGSNGRADLGCGVKLTVEKVGFGGVEEGPLTA